MFSEKHQHKIKKNVSRFLGESADVIFVCGLRYLLFDYLD